MRECNKMHDIFIFDCEVALYEPRFFISDSGIMPLALQEGCLMEKQACYPLDFFFINHF